MQSITTIERAKRFALGLAMGLSVLVGCAGEPGGRAGWSPVASREAGLSREIEADPVDFLRKLHARCATIEQYRLTFYRQERLGLIPKLQPMETIRARYRRHPLSVKFLWENVKDPYCQAVYVEGSNDDKLLIRERRGVLFLPPQVRVLNVEDPVTLGRSKNPITAFGLESMARRTLAPFDDPRLRDVMTIDYEGVVALDPTGRPAHRLHIKRPPMTGYRYTRQDFYVDVETGLPAGTDLWLPNGQLDARYRYADVDTDVAWTDADFELGACPPTTAPSKKE